MLSIEYKKTHRMMKLRKLRVEEKKKEKGVTYGVGLTKI